MSTNGGTLPRRMPPEIIANEIISKPPTRIISPSKTVTSEHKIMPKNMEDLILLQGPLTEDAVMRTLHARFNDGKYFVSLSKKKRISICKCEINLKLPQTPDLCGVRRTMSDRLPIN